MRRVEGNYVFGVSNDDEGFYIWVSDEVQEGSSRFRVVNNTAERNIDNGFNIYGDNILVRGNTARKNGGDSYHDGFYISGNNNLIVDNLSEANSDDGFEIQGSDNVVRNNIARGNSADGIYVSGTGNTLDQNGTIGNHGEGIENDGTATVLTNNVSRDNRLDCAGSQPPATESGNTCEDGSDFSEDGDIDRPPPRNRRDH